MTEDRAEPGAADDPTFDPAGSVPDAARAVLSRMRAAARSATPARQAQVPTGTRPSRRRPRPAAGGYSGPAPDGRDPLTIGSAWAALVDDQGWRAGLDVASLHGLWPQIVGSANAEHAPVESFELESRQLIVRATSTAWAEQLRLMLPAVRKAVDAHVGPGVVRDIRILGPAPPPTRGRLRVRGRGPRDTYG